MSIAVALSTSALVAGTPFASAQDALLPDQVVTATRIPTFTDQIPAGVTVIDRATIEQRGYTTLVEALSEVPGLRVVQSGGQGGNASVFLRGTDSDHVLVLRDGVPVTDPSDPNGAFNFGVDTLGDVERIEVIRGPMSGIYGSGAIGGVINIISRKGSGDPHGSVSAAVGAPLQVQTQANVSGASGKFDYSASVESDQQRGFDTTPQRESIYTGNRNGYRDALGTVNLGYTPIDGTRLSLLLRGREAKFGLDELGEPSYDATAYSGTDDTWLGRLGAASELFQGLWETSLYLSRAQTDRRYLEPLEAADPNQSFGDSRYHGARTDLQWNNTVHLPDFGPATNAALTFAYEHIADSSVSRLNTSTGGFAYQSDVHASDTSDAGHAGLQATLWRRLTVTADLREEQARYGGDAFTWRLGGVLALPEIWSRLKAAYGTAFRAPSLYDLFGVDSYGYVGNPALKPERSEGGEVGWAVDLPALGRRDAATLEVTYFDTRIHDLIQYPFTPVYTAENVARARAYGVESSLTLRPASWLLAVASYTYTEARDLTDDTQLLRRPKNQASLDVRATPIRGLTIAPELVYSGGYDDYLVDDGGFALSTTGPMKAGLIANLTVTYDVTPRIQVFADGKNLANAHYEPASGYQTPGASVLAGTRLRF
jgi:vitamin B12 transporter